MKQQHHVKIRRGGKLIADARIVAESPSDAVKRALRGEGIDLSRVKPDESYTVSSGNVMSSAFGDEFAQTADFSGDDVASFDGHLHATQVDFHDTGIYPGVLVGREREKLRQFVDAYGQNPAGIIARILEDQGFEISHESLDKAREFFDAAYPHHYNCRSILDKYIEQ